MCWARTDPRKTITTTSNAKAQRPLKVAKKFSGFFACFRALVCAFKTLTQEHR
jgi:hypothetical protein